MKSKVILKGVTKNVEKMTATMAHEATIREKVMNVDPNTKLRQNKIGFTWTKQIKVVVMIVKIPEQMSML